MMVAAVRENTFKVDLTNFEKRPSFEDVHKFIFNSVGLRTQQVKRLQMNHVQSCVHVKCDDLQTALNVVEQHNNRHELEVDGKRYKVRLVMDDERTQVKIYDLSENVSDAEISSYLQQYGEVHEVKEAVWGKNFVGKGISSGVRVAKMTLRCHIKSFVTIKGEQTLISYKTQPQTCRHCTNLLHTGRTCVENKKLLRLSSNNKDTTDGNSDSTINVVSISTGAPDTNSPLTTTSQNANSQATKPANELNQHHQKLQQQQQSKRPIDRSDSTTNEKSPPRKRQDSRSNETATDDDSDMETVCDEGSEDEPQDPEKWLIWIQKKKILSP